MIGVNGMVTLAQVMSAAATTGLPTMTVLFSLLISNQRLNNLSGQLDQRFDEHREVFRSELYRLEQVMDARLKHI